ncbi:unnamed protein product, partial [Rotaria magnacalcarata]
KAQKKTKQALKHVVLYLTLSSYNNEQLGFLHRLFLDKNLEEVPKYKDLLQRFKTQALIHSKDILKHFENELKNEILNEQSVYRSSLMTIMNKTCHLINREEIVHVVRT